jgi:DNA-directed RNA polymerase specialized sigma subunit
MKKYNISNYVRYKEDVKRCIQAIKSKRFVDYKPEELKVIFLPLVENIARKFATAQEASGVMSINDIIQEGSLQLCKAVNKIDRERLVASEDIEQTLKSFLAKRIRGGIRRAIDINRGTMRIPEHKLNEMRKDGGKDKKMVAMFFNSIFLSIDANPSDDNMVYQIPDKSDPYNETLLNSYS